MSEMMKRQDEAELELGWTSQLAEYRSACPEIEPAADFMPRLWHRIEARNTYRRSVQTFARLFVTAAGCLCVVLSSFLLVPLHSVHPGTILPYVDALAEYHAANSLTEIQNVHIDSQPED
jgi:hypothetical protein